MQFLSAPNIVLFLQNAGTLLLLSFGDALSVFELGKLEVTKAVKWFPLVLLFYAMLASSMFALMTVSATTLIVQRNLGTVSIAVADYFYIGTIQSKRKIFAIAGMLVGACTYAWDHSNATTFDMIGYLWLGVNIAATTAYQIKVKSLVNELQMSSWTMSYYNNFLSLPVCLAVGVCNQEHIIPLQGVYALDSARIAALSVSCTLGFILSVSAFQLNRLVTPTTITVLNNANKFALLIFTVYFMDYSTLSMSSICGAVVVLGSAAYYSLQPRK